MQDNFFEEGEEGPDEDVNNENQHVERNQKTKE